MRTEAMSGTLSAILRFTSRYSVSIASVETMKNAMSSDAEQVTEY